MSLIGNYLALFGAIHSIPYRMNDKWDEAGCELARVYSGDEKVAGLCIRYKNLGKGRIDRDACSSYQSTVQVSVGCDDVFRIICLK